MSRHSELIRFILNGLAATAVHFLVLTFGLEVARLPSAALANFVAACAGITVSFLGNRYFVFRGSTGCLVEQAWRFAGLYGAIACVHTLLLLMWTDIGGLDYRVGFVVATLAQVSLSYLGNRFLVFAK